MRVLTDKRIYTIGGVSEYPKVPRLPNTLSTFDPPKIAGGANHMVAHASSFSAGGSLRGGVTCVLGAGG